MANCNGFCWGMGHDMGMGMGIGRGPLSKESMTPPSWPFFVFLLRFTFFEDVMFCVHSALQLRHGGPCSQPSKRAHILI